MQNFSPPTLNSRFCVLWNVRPTLGTNLGILVEPGRIDYTGRVMVRQQTIWYRSQLVKKLKIDRYYRSQLVRNLKIDRYVSRTKIVQYQELL